MDDFYLDDDEQRLMLEVLDFLERTIRSGMAASWSLDLLAAWPRLSVIQVGLRAAVNDADD